MRPPPPRKRWYRRRARPPRNVLIATPSNAEAALSWTAPAATGGVALIGYNLYEGTTAGGESYSSPVNGAGPITGTSSTVNGLTNGHTYYFTVKAVNAVGSSLASNEAWAIPGATVADAPQSVNAVAGNEGNVVVTWNAPLKSGGSSITGYAVTPYIGRIAQTARIFDSTVTAETVADLQAGTSYSFTVEAINVSGTGAQSAPSPELSACPWRTQGSRSACPRRQSPMVTSRPRPSRSPSHRPTPVPYPPALSWSRSPRRPCVVISFLRPRARARSRGGSPSSDLQRRRHLRP